MHFSRRRPLSLSLSFVPVFALIALLFSVVPAQVLAQNPWTRLKNPPPFAIAQCLVLTDGTVVCDGGNAFNGGTGTWCKLTPDANGSYINGTWSLMPSMPSGYGPLYYASVVLPDGRLLTIGGEYNLGSTAFTNLGAIYDPVSNKWSNFAGPATWPNIGDAQCAVLADGRFMLANPLSQETAIYNPVTGTWAAPGVKGKNDDNDEEGWTLLPNGHLLTVDVNSLDSEVFDPLALGGVGQWMLAGPTPVQLADIGEDLEMGPQVLRPDGTVIAFGATGHNAVYNTSGGSWVVAPDFPLANGVQLGCADAPASILANGNVLVVTSPGVFEVGAKFFVWNGATLTAVPSTPNSPNKSCFEFRMVVLPSGEVMVTDGTTDVQLYTAGNTPQNAWRPAIATAPSTVVSGQTYTLTGTQFNGLTQGADYGDDAASATNFPLVRVTSRTDGSVTYLKTHNHSTMGVATGGMPVSTQFDVSTDLANGDYDLVVVANGISSASRLIRVTGAAPNLLLNPKFEKGAGGGWITTPYVIVNDTYEPPHGGNWKAWLCGYGKTHTDTLSQNVTIPANATSAILSFWLHVDTQEPSNTAHDKLTVQIKTLSGATMLATSSGATTLAASSSGITTLATYSNLNASNGYTQKMFDISAFKGQTIQVLLTGVEDRVYATNFLLDDFALNAPTSGP